MDAVHSETYSGTWKITGYASTHKKYRKGLLELQQKSKSWRCVLRLKCVPNIVVKEYQLTNKIKQIITGRRVIIELTNGDNIHIEPDPPLKPIDLANKLKQIKDNTMSNLLSPLTANSQNQKPSASNSCSPKSSKKTDHDHSEASQKFLVRGQNKSRETLEKVVCKSPNNFYQKGCLLKRTRRMSLPLNDKSNNQEMPMSPTFSWAQKTPIKSQSPGRLQGFSNLGNTCYMNAILQSLFGLDMFMTDLIHWAEKVNQHLEEEKNNFLFHVLLNLFLTKKCSSSTEQNSHLLAEVKKRISTSVKWFSGFEQHDAHEFLGQILDQLKEEIEKVNKEMNMAENKTNALKTDNKVIPADANPTVSNFDFKIKHTITCSGCGALVNNIETFNDLSVDIPQTRALESTWSIQDALDLTFLPEEVDYTCEKCGGKEAIVQHKFSKLPRVLVVHLKRYSFNAQTSRNTKLVQNLIIPKFLTLMAQCSEQTVRPIPAPEPAETLLNSSKFSAAQQANKLGITPKRRLNLDSDPKEPDRDTSLRQAHEENLSTEDTAESLNPESMTDDEMLKLALERSLKDVDTSQNYVSSPQKNHTLSSPQTPQRHSSSSHINVSNSESQTSFSQHQIRACTSIKSGSQQAKHLTEPPYKKTKLEDGQCDSAYNSFCDTDEKNHSNNDDGAPGNKNELNSSGIDTNISDEENKENYIPPDAGSTEEGIEPLNMVPGTKECIQISSGEEYDEEAQLRLAIENSLKDMENMDIQHDLEDDLEKAKQLSLEDVDKQTESCVITQQKQRDKRDLKRNAKEEEDLKEHAQKGHLPYSYQLVSIVSHIGTSSNSGHYISDTYDMNRRTWYTWNDSHGQRVAWDDLQQERERSGYLFFYAVKDIVEDIENHYYRRKCRVRSVSLTTLSQQSSSEKPSSAIKLTFNKPWVELR